MDKAENLPDMDKVKAGTERKAEFTTNSGIPVKAAYTPEDIKDLGYDRDIGNPGQEPYTRGIYPTMYRGKFWTIRQFAGLNAADMTNERYKFLYQMGLTGFAIAPDVPSISLGRDPDDPWAENEVGVTGVSVSSMRDMEEMFDGIPIDKISTAVIAGIFTSCPLTAMYFAMAENRGVDLKQLNGTSQGDPCASAGCALQESYNNLYDNIDFSHMTGLTVDLIEWCATNAPKWHPISFASYNYRESGVNAPQEIGGLLAAAVDVIEQVLSRGRGLSVDDFVPQFTFHLASHNDFFEEIAKMRAARRMWYKIIKERYNAKDSRSSMLKFHVQTSGSTLTYQQPLNNAVRVSFQTMAAVLGGCQSLHADSYDEALCIPTDESVLLSLRTHQIAQEESNVTNTVDPLAGSYYVEWLTNEVEKRAWEFLGEIEERGGWCKAFDSGWLTQVTQREALKYESEIRSGQRRVVGVNCYEMEQEPFKPSFYRRDPQVLEKTQAKLAQLKQERDNLKVEETLREVRESTARGDNVMPSLMKAVKAYATLGEICGVWRKLWAPGTVQATR